MSFDEWYGKEYESDGHPNYDMPIEHMRAAYDQGLKDALAIVEKHAMANTAAEEIRGKIK